MKKGFYRQNDNLTEEERLELKADIEILEQDVDELIENSKETIQKLEDVYLVEEQDKRISELEEHCADTRKTARYEQTREDYQDVMLDALTLENDSKKVTIANQSGVDINLSESKEDDYAKLKTIKGNTIINRNQEPYKEIILNPVDINESDNKKVILEGQTADGGLIDVYLEGETLVNVSDTKEETLISSEKVLTEIEENTYQIEEDILRPSVKGNTLVNVSEENETLVDMVQTGSVIEKNDIGDNARITKLSGRTMVNVCDQKDSIPLTKSYTVETGNHIALEGEYDGKAKPYVYGNTLVNHIIPISNNWYKGGTGTTESTININGNYISGEKINDNGSFIITCDNNAIALKPSTTYTAIYDVKQLIETADSDAQLFQLRYNDGLYYTINKMTLGKNIAKFTTYNKSLENSRFVFGYQGGFTGIGVIEIGNIIILEGDYTDKPIPQYFEGLQSSFESERVPENLITKYNTKGSSGYSNGVYTAVANGTAQRLYYDINAKENTTYTVVANITKNTLNNNFALVGWNVEKDNKQIQLPQGFTGIFQQSFTTRNDGKLGSSWSTDLWQENTEGEISLSNLIILEGDYTNYDFSDYDSANGGKYKVEYKVIGKNKVPYVENGDIYSTNGKNENSTAVLRTGWIPIKANVNYYFSETTKPSDSEWNCVFLYDKDKKYISYNYNRNQSLPYDGYIRIKRHNPKQESIDSWQVQVEEGYTATSYEPYKEYTKTLYLNSPLLEGDSIELSGNNIVHVHRYKEVVLDGSELEYGIHEVSNDMSNVNLWYAILPESIGGKMGTVSICDKLLWGVVDTTPNEDYEHHRLSNGAPYANRLYLWLNKNKCSTVEECKQYLQQNPMTVVYELVTPTYELILSNDNLYVDSYVNGHLDFDSVVPVDKVEFQQSGNLGIKYLKPSTEYVVQFEADGIGKVDVLNLGRGTVKNISVTKGINKVIVTTPNEIAHERIFFPGIGANISNIVVTEAIDEEFGYFEGMTSAFEDNYVTNNVKDYTNAYMREVTYINNIYEIKWGTNINQSALRPKVGAFNYKPNTTYTIIADIIENTCNQQLGLSPFNAPVVIWETQSLHNFALLGKSAVAITTTTDMSVQKGNSYEQEIYFGIWAEGGDLSNGLKFKYWVLEGDYTGYDLDKLMNAIDKYPMKYQVRNTSNRFGKGGKL